MSVSLLVKRIEAELEMRTDPNSLPTDLLAPLLQ